MLASSIPKADFGNSQAVIADDDTVTTNRHGAEKQLHVEFQLQTVHARQESQSGRTETRHLVLRR